MSNAKPYDTCPHCQGLGISQTAKRRSSREHPAKCTLCGGLSHVIASSRSGITGFTLTIVLVFAVLGAIHAHLGIGALTGVPFAAAYNIWAWNSAELFPISPESAAAARKLSWVVNALALLGIFGS